MSQSNQTKPYHLGQDMCIPESSLLTLPHISSLSLSLSLSLSHTHTHTHSYSSGGEDGYVRVHKFDPSYFKFDFEY